MIETRPPIEYLNQHLYVQEDIDAVYKRGEIEVGSQEKVNRFFSTMVRRNTAVIIGSQFGDEGKGRVVDNKIKSMLNAGMKIVTVVRSQGGSNAGHSLETENGKKIVLHQVPSGILYEEVVGLMDRGMVLHMEDLRTEITIAENLEEVGSLKDKLIISPEAMLATDLERALEVLNRELSSGKSSGGTGRGIAPTVAASIDRTGFRVNDLLGDDWEQKLGNYYELIEKSFSANGRDLSDIDVPDLELTKKEGVARARKLGTKKEFLDRLADVRTWFLDRNKNSSEGKNLFQNTYHYHGNIYRDLKHGIIFEMAQAVGIDPVHGRWPDVTSTPTTVEGVIRGTAFPLYARGMLQDVIGVAKLTYMSSVGQVRMPTDSGLLRDEYSPEQLSGLINDQKHALWIRKHAHEYGATTGRPRDIAWMDLSLMAYNILAGGINQLAFTHGDIAKDSEEVLVCTHYVDLQGNVVPYQPGVLQREALRPVFINLPGWDGEVAAKARSFEELPENCKKFLAFMQRRLRVPITMLTVGPKRDEAFEIA